MSVPIHRLIDLAETCVFTKQSYGPLHCDPDELASRRCSLFGTPLLPKLRGHFAEFLNEGYIERLRIFSSSTCVGLRYEHPTGLLQKLFLGSIVLASSPSLAIRLPYTPHPPLFIADYRYGRALPIARWPNCLRHFQNSKRLSRWCRNILPCCPSLTPFGLSLGSTNPGRINLPQETLDFRRICFSQIFSLLIPALSLPFRPVSLTADLRPKMERSPTTPTVLPVKIRSFGYELEPRSLSAQDHIDQ